MEYTINEVFDIKEEQIYQANEFLSKSEHELMHWRRALEESILMGKPCFPPPSHPLSVCGPDGDCYIIGIANGFQMKQESMTPRGENDKETIKTEDRVYPLRYDE